MAKKLRVGKFDSRPPWISRCPNGHARVIYRSTLDETVCNSCDTRWKGRPFNAKRAEFPVSNHQFETAGGQQ